MRISPITVLLTVILCIFAGCKSADKDAPEASETVSVESGAKNPASGSGKEAATSLDCASRPDPAACCQAFIPSCNECRANAQKALSAWENQCLTLKGDPDCSKATPLIACCAGDSDECVSCRKQALNVLMEWKEKCNLVQDPTCAGKPAPSECCPGISPTCNACRDRNERILTAWKSRCESSK